MEEEIGATLCGGFACQSPIVIGLSAPPELHLSGTMAWIQRLTGAPMATLSFETRDMLHSLSWYMSARQTALRAALNFRTQLSVDDQRDIRVHYSGYFLNLLGATELMRETTALPPKDFETLLYSRFVFTGFPDGEANYGYITNLRNAIVHRGLDITSAAHIDGNFPMMFAEPTVQNQRRTKTFLAFDKYLLHVIAKCESVIPQVMLDCLNTAGIFQATIDAQAAVVEYRNSVQQSHAMPDFAKTMSPAADVKPEWFLEAHDAMKSKLRALLTPCNASKPV